MVENEQACTEGIAFVAYMNTWKMENFCLDCCYQFMQLLQGNAVPVRVGLFLIVNPPSWFGPVWKIMKRMLSRDFRTRVKMIPESGLPKYLAEGFEEFLPDETEIGRANTTELVQDFVAYRKRVE
jgi:hypothetical protein